MISRRRAQVGLLVLQSSAVGLTCAGRDLAGGVGCAGHLVTCIARGDSVGAEFRSLATGTPYKDYTDQNLLGNLSPGGRVGRAGCKRVKVALDQ